MSLRLGMQARRLALLVGRERARILSSRWPSTDPSQEGLIRGPIVFQADDLRVAIMPETYAVPRLGRELMSTLFRKE